MSTWCPSLTRASSEGTLADEVATHREVGAWIVPWPDWVAMWETGQDLPDQEPGKKRQDAAGLSQAGAPVRYSGPLHARNATRPRPRKSRRGLRRSFAVMRWRRGLKPYGGREECAWDLCGRRIPRLHVGLQCPDSRENSAESLLDFCECLVRKHQTFDCNTFSPGLVKLRIVLMGLSAAEKGIGAGCHPVSGRMLSLLPGRPQGDRHVRPSRNSICALPKARSGSFGVCAFTTESLALIAVFRRGRGKTRTAPDQRRCPRTSPGRAGA